MKYFFRTCLTPAKLWPYFLAIGLISFFGCSACKDSKSRIDHANFELSIHRETVVGTKSEPHPETGYVSEQFDLPVNTLLGLLEAGAAGEREPPTENPFADPVTTPAGPIHEAFQAMGIPFPPGTSATYDADKKLLSVTQTPESMALIRHLTNESRGIPNSAAIRFEFYEVPALLALRLEQSAAAHFDNTPEWKALQELLDNDDIRLLQVATIQSRSGERAKFENGETFVYRSGPRDDVADAKNEAINLFEERLVGTIIETDLVVGTDAHAMNLNFYLEYHSAPPEWITTADGTDSPTATVFHIKKLTTNFTIHDGQTRLLTSWTPTGKAENNNGDRRILVFLAANLQRNSQAER